jgi:hypothetical protein
LTDQVLPPPVEPEPEGPAPSEAASWRLLFTGGPRIGWVFRDRRELVPAYTEPKPGPETIQARAAARATAADTRFRRAWKWAGKPSIGLVLLLVVLAGCARVVGGGGTSSLLTLITALVLGAPGLAYTGWCWLERDKARDISPEQEYQRAVADWEQHAASHASTQFARLAGQPEWGSVNVPPRRTDVFGGTLPGWHALVAVHGASLLSGRPLLIADLTGMQAAAPLLSLAREAGIGTTTWELPRDLGRSGILGDLPADRLAVAVAEALHAGAPGGARAERAADTELLRQLAYVLTPAGVTMPRLAAAVRTALGRKDEILLTAAERDEINGTLFPPGGTREQAAPGLARLNAVLPRLASQAADAWPSPPARCTCLSLDSAPRDAGTEILAALAVQWITYTASATAADTFPAVIIAGADTITTAHAEALADACELRGIPLTLLFRHLRDDTAGMLGGAATTAFMRLGNHHEAEQAAGYLGRHHTYQMSSFTATRGGSTTNTTGGGQGYSTSESTGESKNRGRQDTGFFGTGGTSSGGRSRTTGTSTSENRSENWSSADGTNWSKATGLQRVYEYRVEPEVLQNLPEQALLLADRTPGSLRLRAVECDPAIITLPGASTIPLPPPPAMTQGGPPAVNSTNTAARPLSPASNPNASEWPQPDATDAVPTWPPGSQHP